MKTTKQTLGDRGEAYVVETLRCPGCKRLDRTLRTLPANFKCADVICDFCGYLAQVKTVSVEDSLPTTCPRTILGAAWGPQKQRMDSGIFISLFVVVVSKSNGEMRAFFLPGDLQTFEMFVPRNPLSSSARRSGWQGFILRTDLAIGVPVACDNMARVQTKA